MKKSNKKNLVKWGLIILAFGLVIFLFFAWLYSNGFFNFTMPSYGSMYLKDDILYYGAKKGGICTYNQDTGCKYIIKKADCYFGCDDEYIYYTYKNKCYRYGILNSKSEEISVIPEDVKIIYPSEMKNSSEVNELLSRNSYIFDEGTYAILEDDTLYAAVDNSGGYIAVYKVYEGDNYLLIDIDSKVMLDYSYTALQFNKFSGRGYFANGMYTVILIVLISLVCLILILKFLSVLKKYKKV